MPIGFGNSNLLQAAGGAVTSLGNKIKSDRGEGKIDSLPENLNKFGRSDSFDQTVLRYPIDLGNTYSKYAIKFDIFLQTDPKIVVPEGDAKEEENKEAGAKEQVDDLKLIEIQKLEDGKKATSDELRDIEIKYLKIKDYNIKDPKKGFWANGYKVGESSNLKEWKIFEKGGGSYKFGDIKLTDAELQQIKTIRADYKAQEEKWKEADDKQKKLKNEKNESKDKGKDKGDFKSNAMTLRRNAVFKHQSAIALYFPAKVTNNTTATYQDVDVSNYTTAAAGAVMSKINTLFSGGKVSVAGLKGIIGNFEALIQDQIEQALPGLRETGEIMSGRNIRADRMEVAFKGVARRSFSFDFKFMPKSEKEAIEVKKIIQRFRTYQMPKLSTSRMSVVEKNGKAVQEEQDIDRNERLGGKTKPKTDGKIYYDSPGFFDISFMIQANTNDYPIKMGRSVLESVNVTYGGARTSFFKLKGGDFKDADGAPTEITMSLSFKEVETLYRERVAKDGY